MSEGSLDVTSTAGSSGEAGGSGETATAATYRPHLDGLRAVAVYLVVLFHAGNHAFSGGYIGVDVFFVLSGYLVTQLLLRDIARGGAIRFGRFYSRRFRRLLPAAFVALVVTAAVFTAISKPVEVANAAGSFKAAFLYSANWYFIHQSSGYFGADISANPVLHFWSLAVEEQFYLLWPLALGGVFLLTRRLERRRQLRAIAVGVAVAAVVSAVWALSLKSSNPDRAYYGTDTRAYELLGGALIALVPAFAFRAKQYVRSVRIATLATVAALLVLGSSWVHLDAIERGIAVTVTTCLLLVAIEAADGGLMQRALSRNSMVYLGKVSYGTYLWHWLVILVVLRIFHPSAIATVGIACLVATALASLSFEMLERPVRTSSLLDGHRRVVIASGLAISVVSALVLIPNLVAPANASKQSRESSVKPLLTPIPKNLAYRGESIAFTKCLGEPVSDCTIAHGTGKHILLMGDSHAWMLILLFSKIAREDNLTLSVTGMGACPWQRGLYTPTYLASCKKLKEDEYKRVIPQLHPDIIVLMNLGYGHKGPYPGPLIDGAHKRKALPFSGVERLTRASVAQLEAGGRQLLIIEPVPLPHVPSDSFDPLTCLERAKFEEECRYKADAKTTPLERLYRNIAKHDSHVHTLNLDRSICPLLPVCDPVIDGMIVKRDQSHLTTAFAKALAPEVETYMKSVGILAR